MSMLEVMSVVVILGALAAVALPTFQSYIKRARASEALLNVEKMWTSATAYYAAEHADENGVSLGHQFPDTGPATPAANPTSEHYYSTSADWSHPTWNALNFVLDTPHRYQYLYVNLAHCDPPGGGGPTFDLGGPFGNPGGPFAGMDEALMIECDGSTSVICHKAGGNPASWDTMRIGDPSLLNAHLKHGDSLGGCPGDIIIEEGFFAFAVGNLDGDDVYSFFWRASFLMTNSDPRGMPVTHEMNPME